LCYYILPLQELGFVRDTNFLGEIVQRIAGITNEMQQRAKILSHIVQQVLRLKRFTDTKQVKLIRKKRKRNVVKRNIKTTMKQGKAF